jgi:hypothetical protein
MAQRDGEWQQVALGVFFGLWLFVITAGLIGWVIVALVASTITVTR